MAIKTGNPCNAMTVIVSGYAAPYAFCIGSAPKVMAKHCVDCGLNFHAVMELGEWKSSAVLNYVDQDMVDKNMFNEEMVDSDSDSE